MSIACMTRVWAHSRHQGSELLLLLAIADYADDDGVAWPSLDQLAQKVRLSRRAVQTLLRRIEASGELVIERGRGRGHTSVYRLVIGANSDANITVSGTSPLRNGDAGVTVSRRKGEAPRRKGEESRPKKVKPASPRTVIEPSIEPSVGSVASQPAAPPAPPRVENSRASPHGPEPIGAVLGRMAGIPREEPDPLHARRTALFAEVQRLAWLGKDPPVREGEDQAGVRRHEAKILGELCAAMTDAEIMAALHGARAQLGPEVPYRLLLLMHHLPSGRTLAQVFAARGLGRESGALPAQVIRALREALEAA